MMRAAQFNVTHQPFSGDVAVRTPLPLPPGRNGLGPILEVAFDASSNGCFGEGWSLVGLPSISQAPWHHAKHAEVAATLAGPITALDEPPRIEGDWTIERWLPRTSDGHPLTFERLTHTSRRTLWRSYDALGTCTIYGPDTQSLSTDPSQASAGKQWHVRLQVAATGDAILYEWDEGAGATRFPRRIRWLPDQPLNIDAAPDALMADISTLAWGLEAVFDYSDIAGDSETGLTGEPVPQGAPAPRVDTVTDRVLGLPIVHDRLCRRLLVVHRLKGLTGGPELSTAHEFGYDDTGSGPRLSRVRTVCYRPEVNASGARDRTASPWSEISYAAPQIANGFAAPPPDVRACFDAGLRVQGRQIDLLGDGRAGFLRRAGGAWSYRANLGNGRYGAPAPVHQKPARAAGGVDLQDLDKDGRVEAVDFGFNGGTSTLDRNGNWSRLHTFERIPRVGQGARFADLSGGGQPDKVALAPTGLRIWPSRGADGFEDRAYDVTLPKQAQEALRDLRLLDMTGDGLADLVQLERGVLRWWPGLGGGRFDQMQVAEGLPHADLKRGRVLMHPIWGRQSDVILLLDGRLEIWRRTGATRFELVTRRTAPRLDSSDSLRMMDIDGRGHLAIVVEQGSRLQVMRLSSGAPIGMPTRVSNGIGGTTDIIWGHSSDHVASRSVPTGLARVHKNVVARIEHRDAILGRASAQSWRYECGVRSPDTGTMIGFAVVEEVATPLVTPPSNDDAEIVAAAVAAGWPDRTANPAKRSMTRTYFHIGEEVDRPPVAPALPRDLTAADHIDPRLSQHPKRHAAALAALRGRVRLSEVIEIDPNGEQTALLSRSAVAFDIFSGPVARHDGGQPVIFTLERETVQQTVEGGQDPRVDHHMVLDHDVFGRQSVQLHLAYPRIDAQALPEQKTTLARVERTTFAATTTVAGVVRAPVETEVFSLNNLALSGPSAVEHAQIKPLIEQLLQAPHPHGTQPPSNPTPLAPTLVREGWERFLHVARDGSPLPLGQIDVPVRRSHIRVATLADATLGTTLGADLRGSLPALGHRLEDGCWWHDMDRLLWGGTDQFCLSIGSAREDGGNASIIYDNDMLFPTRVENHLGHVTETRHDYLALAPARVDTPTGAWERFRYDPMGRVWQTAQGGTVPDAAGGTVPFGDDPEADRPRPVDFDAALRFPEVTLAGAGTVTLWDDLAFSKDGSPTREISMSATASVHDGTGQPPPPTKAQVTVSWFDGFGEAAQSKSRAGPGQAARLSAKGAAILDENGIPDAENVPEKWMVGGASVRDPLDRVVASGIGYATPSPDWSPQTARQPVGPPTHRKLDAMGRAEEWMDVDGTLGQARLGAWSVETLGANDLADVSPWGLSRQAAPANSDAARELAAAKAAGPAPTTAHLDPLGRTVRATRSGAIPIETRTILDASGHAVGEVDALGRQRSKRVFDMAGREIVEEIIGLTTTRLVYDAHGRVAQVVRDGSTLIMGFDPSDRPTFTDLQTPLGTRRIEVWDYADDPTDPATLASNVLGLAIRHRDESGEQHLRDALPDGSPRTFEHRLPQDPHSPIDWATTPALQAEVHVTRTGAVPGVRAVQTSHPGGAITTTFVDAFGTPERTEMDLGLGAIVTSQAPVADVVGKATSQILGNGARTERTYLLGHDRLTRLRTTRSATAGRSTLLRDARFGFDAAGAIISITDHAHTGVANAAFAPNAGSPEATRRFAYDALGRLIKAEGRADSTLAANPSLPHAGPMRDQARLHRYAQTYSYDEANNLKRIVHTGTAGGWTTDFVIDALDRALPLPASGIAPDLGQVFVGGNLTRPDHLARLDWSEDDRLTQAVLLERAGGPDDVERYLYTSGGTRILKTTQRFGANALEDRRETLTFGPVEIARHFTGGQLRRERITLRVDCGLGDFAHLSRETVGPEADRTAASWAICDHQGTPVLWLDAAGAVLSYEETLPFGGRAFAWRKPGGGLPDHLRFLGRVRDDATGLHHISHRYYATWLCRWISADPAGFIDGSNLYAYARNNPVTYHDNTGLKTEGETGRLIASGEATPAAVHSAFAALPLDKQRAWIALRDQGKAMWLEVAPGEVRFGSKAELTPVRNQMLAANTDVYVLTGSGSGVGADTEGESGTSTETPGLELDLPVFTETPQDFERRFNQATGMEGENANTATQPSDGDDQGTTDTQTAAADGSGQSASQTAPGAKTPSAAGHVTGADNASVQGAGSTPTSASERNKENGLGTGTSGQGSGGGGAATDGQGRAATGAGTSAPKLEPIKTKKTGDGFDPGGQKGGKRGGAVDGSKDAHEMPDPGETPKSGAGGTKIRPDTVPKPIGPAQSGHGTDAKGLSTPPDPDTENKKLPKGAGSPDERSTLDKIVHVVGYTQLEFGGKGGGKSGGIPGGFGNKTFGWAGQALFLGLVAVEMVASFFTGGGYAAAKAWMLSARKVVIAAATASGRRALAASGVKKLRAAATRTVDAVVQSKTALGEISTSVARAASKSKGFSVSKYRIQLSDLLPMEGRIIESGLQGSGYRSELFGKIQKLIPPLRKIKNERITIREMVGLPLDNGGHLWTSTTPIINDHIVHLLYRRQRNDKDRFFHIITGRHGNSKGVDKGMRETGFYKDELFMGYEDWLGELRNAGDILPEKWLIHDYYSLSPEQIKALTEQGDDVILSWCYSDHTQAVINALFP